MTRVPALRDLNTSTHYQRCVYFGIFGFLIVERTPGVLWSWYIFFGLRPNHFTWKCHSCECKRSSRSFWGVQPLEVWCNDVFPVQSVFSSPMLVTSHRVRAPSITSSYPLPISTASMPTSFIPFRLMKPSFGFLVRRSYRLYEKGGFPCSSSDLHWYTIQCRFCCSVLLHCYQICRILTKLI